MKSDKPGEMIATAASLGYTTIGVDTKVDFTELDIVKRLDLDPRNPNELLISLRSKRWTTEIITVHCRNKSVARQAGRDHRVDLITYPIQGNWRDNSLDRQQASLMRDSGCGYLLDLSHLLLCDRYLLRKNIEYLRRNTRNAMKRDVPVVASMYPKSVWGLRDPYGLVALLGLLGIDEDKAAEMVSSTPYGLVEKNRDKLKTTYIASGVRIIEDE